MPFHFSFVRYNAQKQLLPSALRHVTVLVPETEAIHIVDCL